MKNNSTIICYFLILMELQAENVQFEMVYLQKILRQKTQMQILNIRFFSFFLPPFLKYNKIYILLGSKLRK